MAFDVVHAADLEWEEREAPAGEEPRRHAVVTDTARLTQSRARMWRYPARTQGRRHVDPDQEEVFVPLRGTLTLLLEDPPRRVDVEPGGLVVPVLVVEETSARRAFARAWQLARAGYVHVLGSLATLAIVVFLTQSVLAFILRGAGGTAVSTAFVLANVVISPLLFVGAALLYVDQSARVE